ncbi:MAG: KH domain-containing protein [Desulfovibrio sp.]|nr:MAG: KH domain-containing protein [Desulfovibrio sp.]
MNDFREFEGKSIDEAIEAACDFFDEEREKLELEILNDSKGGIFGLVGGRKAMVKARLLDTNAELKALVADIIHRLCRPITGVEEMELHMDVEPGRVYVVIHDEEHSGLIIGREGQTLAAIQYLANRIAAKRLPEPMRIQIDTDDYRERQDENLRQLALHLAEKAKSNGRPQSTRPLSSYHRRVVHMALQEDGSVQTRSKGEGPMKRVLILPKRSGGRQNSQRY